MNCLDFSNDYFDKAVVTVRVVLQEISEIPIYRTFLKAASATWTWYILVEVKRNEGKVVNLF